ncbi:MAG TPA: ASCH domain-containing protein [Pyrinomonadaceae bacterium]
MKALSIKQPWAHAILHLGKDIENRDWSTNIRGTIALHASKTMTADELKAFIYVAIDIADAELLRQMMHQLDKKQMPFGAIVGTVEIVGCVKQSKSPWFFGDFGFELKNPKPLKEPIPCKGALGFWNVPEEIKERIFKELRR